MKVKIRSNGHIPLPIGLRKMDLIRPGAEFRIERVNAGQYLLKRVSDDDDVGLVQWLLACPEKGWFEPIASQ